MSTIVYEKSVDPVESDGRDIDPLVGELAGEAAGQKVASISDPHFEKAAQTWKQIPAACEQDPTYYDRPVLKGPVWSWESPLYYFTGGTAGACLALGAAAQLDGSGRLNRLIRRSHWAGIIGSSVSAVLLIDDLGRPSRFLHMLRVFRPTSPMNIGTWILSGAAPTAITAGLLLHRRGFLRWLGEGFGFASGVFGLGLATGVSSALPHSAQLR